MRHGGSSWKATALIILGVLVLVGSFAMEAQAQERGSLLGCSDPHPLFITSVEFRPGSVFHEDSVIFEEKAPFVHEDDQIQIRLTVENLLNPGCEDLPHTATEDLELRIDYLPGDEKVLDPVRFTDCSDGRIDPGDTCTTLWASLPGDQRVKWDPGEQRLRFMIQNDERPDGFAGAERIIVADQLPDLEPVSLDWSHPEDPDDRRTAYTTAETRFDILVENDGDYPNWNPNGGNQFADRSSYVGDHDPEAPPEAGDEARLAGSGYAHRFPCDWVSSGEEAGDDEPVCSYRRGQIFDLPIHWRLEREDDQALVQEDVDRSYRFSNASTDSNDRMDAIGQGQESPIEIIGPDRDGLAGTFDLHITLDHDPNETQGFWTPESDDGNNEDTFGIHLQGVDLALIESNLHIEGFDGLCTAPEDPCDPAQHAITVDPVFENAGDIVESRWWNASISLIPGDADEQVALDMTEDPARMAFPDVPHPDAGDQSMFPAPVTIPPESTGGKHVLLIRLDHPEQSYGPQQEASVTEDYGRIAEIHEGLDCPDGYDDPSTWDDSATRDGSLAPSMRDVTNTWCIDLYFAAPHGPEASDPRIESGGDEQDPFEGEVVIHEGEEATFRVNVDAPAGVDRVNATFIGPEDAEGTQTVTEVAMEQNASQDDVWEVEHAFEGDLGQYAYIVTAWDTLDHPSTSEPAPFFVDEWPKTITTSIGLDELNGETTVIGPDAPEYEGTVSEPENWFNLTVNVTDTGHDVQPGDVHFRVWDPDGNVRVDKTRMAPITVCQDDQHRNYWGEECDDENFENPLPFGGVLDLFQREKVHEWTAWYVDTRDDETWDHPTLTLQWVGEFNVEVIVKDAFDRTNHTNWTAQLRDVGPAVLTNETLEPTEVAPGNEIHASGEASDPLRVERVFLNVTKPSGATAEGDFDITEVHDAETQSGVWEGTFTAGVDGDLFDQAGTYEVEMIADDFGTNPNSTTMGTLTVDPGEPPRITSFFTDPTERVEAGHNLTFFAQIEAETAIHPPQLTITKGDGSTETLTLTEDEDTEFWTVTIQPDPIETEETWTYALTVSDHAGQTDTALGTIDVFQNTPPQASNWQPNVQTEDGRYWISTEPTISVDLVDRNGVDAMSIHLRVDGTTVWENGAGDAHVEEIPRTCPDCYRVTYTPPETLAEGETLLVEVKARDLSLEELESDWHTRQFHVDDDPPSNEADAFGTHVAAKDHDHAPKLDPLESLAPGPIQFCHVDHGTAGSVTDDALYISLRDDKVTTLDVRLTPFGENPPGSLVMDEDTSERGHACEEPTEPSFFFVDVTDNSRYDEGDYVYVTNVDVFGEAFDGLRSSTSEEQFIRLTPTQENAAGTLVQAGDADHVGHEGEGEALVWGHDPGDATQAYKLMAFDATRSSAFEQGDGLYVSAAADDTNPDTPRLLDVRLTHEEETFGSTVSHGDADWVPILDNLEPFQLCRLDQGPSIEEDSFYLQVGHAGASIEEHDLRLTPHEDRDAGTFVLEHHDDHGQTCADPDEAAHFAWIDVDADGAFTDADGAYIGNDDAGLRASGEGVYWLRLTSTDAHPAGTLVLDGDDDVVTYSGHAFGDDPDGGFDQGVALGMMDTSNTGALTEEDALYVHTSTTDNAVHAEGPPGLFNIRLAHDTQPYGSFVTVGDEDFTPTLDPAHEVAICRIDVGQSDRVWDDAFYLSWQDGHALNDGNTFTSSIQPHDIRLTAYEENAPGTVLTQANEDELEADAACNPVTFVWIDVDNDSAFTDVDYLYLGYDDGETNEGLTGSSDDGDWWVRMAPTQDHEAGTLVRSGHDDLVTYGWGNLVTETPGLADTNEEVLGILHHDEAPTFTAGDHVYASPFGYEPQDPPRIHDVRIVADAP